MALSKALCREIAIITIVLLVALIIPMNHIRVANSYVLEHGNNSEPCRWSSSAIVVYNQANRISFSNPYNDFYPVQNAIGAWNSVDANLALSTSNNNPNIHVVSTSVSASWNGMTSWTCSNGVMTNTATISLNDYNLNNHFALIENVAAHELGRALGLNDENASNISLMFYSDSSYLSHHIIVPVQDDVNGIISLYGFKLDHPLTDGVESNANIYWPGGGMHEIVNSGQQGGAMVFDPNSGNHNWPTSNITILPYMVWGSTLYRSAVGIWTSTGVSNQSARAATIELDSDGIKLVYSNYISNVPPQEFVTCVYCGTINPNQVYFLELVLQQENDGQGGAVGSAYGYAYQYNGPAMLGEADTQPSYWGSGFTYYDGFGVWTDSSSNPSSDYWWNIPGSIGNTSAAVSSSPAVVNWATIIGTNGPGWEVDSVGSGGTYNNYAFYAYDPYFDNITVPASGSITVDGYFMKNDSFYHFGLQQGRSNLYLYTVNAALGTIINSYQIMDYTYNNLQWYHISYTITGLTPGENMKIGFGRANAWTYDYELLAAGAQILVTPG